MKTVAISNLGTAPIRWAKENCPTFIRFTLKAITKESVSGSPFIMLGWLAEYHFKNDNDAVLFTLRWL